MEELEKKKTRRTDIIRSKDLDEILDTKIKDFIRTYRPPSTSYVVVRRGTKLYNVLKALASGHPVIVVVVDENRRPIGYITDHHIIGTFQRRPRPRSILASFSISQMSIPIEKSLDIPIDDIMDKRPPVVNMDRRVKDLVRTMRNLGIPAVILVDDKGVIRGVVDRRFLIKTILNKLLGEPMMF